MAMVKPFKSTSYTKAKASKVVEYEEVYEWDRVKQDYVLVSREPPSTAASAKRPAAAKPKPPLKNTRLPRANG